MRRFKIDLWLVIPVLLLCCISLLLLGATTPDQAKFQAIFMLVSALAFLVVSQSDFVSFISAHKLFYIFSCVFLILPYFFGLVSRGANRWLQVGQFSLQPSEIIKPFLFITFAALATSNIRFKTLILLASFSIPAALIFLQPDLGTTLVMSAGWLVVFLSRMSIKKTILGGLCLLIILIPSYSLLLLPYQKDRLQTFINPYSDPLGRGYHIIQSIIAVGSGGLFGRGLGHGTQSELQFLPENHTDFIFASISESFGFFGSLLVIALYIILLSRIYTISKRATNPTVSLWTLAVMGSLAFQIFVNIGMNIGLAPVTGITLPLLSYGGSSLLSLGLTLGLLNSAVAKEGQFLV